MANAFSDEYLNKLLTTIIGFPRETEWIELKGNNKDPRKIGQYISALANSAALHQQPAGYLAWGVHDSNHSIIGTTFDPETEKVGNERLQAWLLRLTDPHVEFSFNIFQVSGKRIVLLQVAPALNATIRFEGVEYIRVDSYKKPLKDHSDHARRLWRVLDRTTFEDGIAYGQADDDTVLDLIDYASYFDHMDRKLPQNRTGILASLAADKLIQKGPTGEWDVTNLGAILWAKTLSSFPTLSRKAVRVVQYRGKNRVSTVREQVGVRGYASGFEGIIDYIQNLLPQNEVIGQALRTSVPLYPDLAVRELVANALIHQDLTERGTGPMIEIFDDRIEITSPGTPLVEPLRFVDAPPRSRNEAVASHMRRIGVCEERGSGWDKVASEIELYQLPAPLIEIPEPHTRVVLLGPRPLKDMDKAEKIRAVYLHSCLRHVTREHTTNTSVRDRFKIEQKNSATASRLLNDTVEAGLITPYDPTAARSQMRYEPFWAAGDERTSI
ncbi:ATP-binding protein [Pseudonocardia sp. GCM10023141]|uniref:ATP-binding protein n=1 Tax=Pseudonocardia sp. GCM10023141 TaxID=3252653 RepID=UPI00360A4AB3